MSFAAEIEARDHPCADKDHVRARSNSKDSIGAVYVSPGLSNDAWFAPFEWSHSWSLDVGVGEVT